jgi:hypothetical protein
MFRHHQRPVAQPNACVRVLLDGSFECRAGNERIIGITSTRSSGTCGAGKALKTVP